MIKSYALLINESMIGAASGIGKGYALELAKEGFNIFLTRVYRITKLRIKFPVRMN